MLGAPQFLKLTEDEYTNIVDNLDVTSSKWGGNVHYEGDGTASATHGFDTGSDLTFNSSLSSLKEAGVIILNKGQTTNNNNFEGHYVGLIDNSNLNPATHFDGILEL